MKSLRSLRALRALRPLRLLSRNPGMRVVIEALYGSLPNVGHVLVFIFIIFLLFAILAVDYLKGTFWACQGDIYDQLDPWIKAFVIDPVPYAELNNVVDGPAFIQAQAELVGAS